MVKYLLLALLMFSAQAQAGIWDDIVSWFSGDETSDTQAPVSPSTTTAAPSAMMETAKVAASTAAELGIGLLPTVVRSLGVTEAQARGGLGAIFMAAKATLAPHNYKLIEDVVPGIDSFIAVAPPTNEFIGGAMSLIGGSKETTAAANLVTQFKDLGLGAEMISRFSNVAVDYISDRSTEASDMLAGVVSDFL